MQAIHIRDLIEKFDQELVRLKYKASSIGNYRVFWKQLITYFERRQEPYFSERTALAFLEERYNLTGKRRTRLLTRNETYVRQMVRKVVFFHEHGEVGRMKGVPEKQINTKEFLEVLNSYAGYCVQYGYSQSTRRHLRYHAIRFFAFLEAKSIRHSSEIAAESIVEYVNSLTTCSYGTVGLILTHLRTLLSFLHVHGYHRRNLSYVLPHQQVRKEGTVPTVWAREDVLKLINATDKGSPGGKRDYAILVLVALLGMRAGDVRTLKLEDLKWGTNQIEFVQSKTERTVCLPLLKDVGWAIIDYLKNGRPNVDSPYVFLRHSAPYNSLHEGNCFYHIIRRCIRIAQITPPSGQSVGMHSLRYTLASTLLGRHTPLPTIAGVLGHASVESTSVYLKTDIEALRECALGEPEVIQ